MSGIPVDDGNCFACGPDNAIGLHLHFESNGGGVRAQIALEPAFQGWAGIAHGGIAMTLLDEAMAHAAAYAGHRGMTASVTARFRKPLPIGVPLIVEGRVCWQRRNVVGVEARVLDERGTPLVEGEGRFVSKGSIDAVADRRNVVFR